MASGSYDHSAKDATMDVEMLQPKGVFQSPAYAQAARIGDTLFIAGQTPRNIDGSTAAPGDIRGQAEKVFENLEAVLNSCGSSLDRVAKLTVYMTSYEYRTAISEVRARVFASVGRPCASTTVVVSGLMNPEWMVEIEAIAASNNTHT
ncbi:MAG: RidA family protein [Chloroflexi bacterium]|nr:RidA family protein [Chloroflexota bacterium]